MTTISIVIKVALLIISKMIEMMIIIITILTITRRNRRRRRNEQKQTRITKYQQDFRFLLVTSVGSNFRPKEKAASD